MINTQGLRFVRRLSVSDCEGSDESTLPAVVVQNVPNLIQEILRGICVRLSVDDWVAVLEILGHSRQSNLYVLYLARRHSAQVGGYGHVVARDHFLRNSHCELPVVKQALERVLHRIFLTEKNRNTPADYGVVK